MAITQNTFTGNGSTTNYSFTFEYIKQADVKASLDGTVTTAFTLANATTLSFNTAPANGVAIRIFRDTNIDNLKATFTPGSAIKAEDLNDNFTQNNFAVQEADFDVSTANTTANTAKTTADAATATANTASTNASNAVTTANTASTNASAAVSTANTASTNASNAVTTANSAATDAATAITTANSATTTANSATTTANAATATANSAVTTANSAASDAAAAVSTANTASTNASSAVSTANSANTTAASAVTTANAATATANTASTNASAAVSTANTASTNASNAVTTANSAASDATSAVSTANTASTNASNAVTTANTASTNATAALNNSRESDGQGGFTSAISKANAAITASNTATAAVSNAVLFDLITNVSSIPGSPSNNDYIEIGDSTGIQNFTPLSGLPSGFTGASGLTVRLRYDSSATSWVFMNYFANDSETRYVAIGNPNPTYYANQAAFPSATTYHGGVAHSHADGAMYYAHGGNWIKMAKDSDVTTNATNISSNTTAIGTKLPLAGGTLTGALTLSGAPSSNLHAATKAYVDTEVAGLVDSAPGTLDTLNELAAALGDDANFSTTVTNSIATKMPLAGGTFTGNVDFNDNVKARFGTGDDLEIFHDGSNTYISDVGVGNLYITSTDGTINLQTNASENAVKCFENGAVNLYYDGSEKLATTSGGISVTGSGTYTTNVQALNYIANESNGAHGVFEGKLNNSRTSIIKADGDATFGPFNSNSTSTRGINLDIAGDNANLTIQSASTSNGGNSALQVFYGDYTDRTATIYMNGSATFKAPANGVEVQVTGGNDGSKYPFVGKNTSGTTTFSVNGDGRLLLGTTTEGEGNADNLTIADSGNCGLTLRSGSSNVGSIYFSDATSGGGEYDGYIDYNQSTRLMRFGTASTTQAVIDSSGRLMLGTTTEGQAYADNLTLNDGGNCGLTIRSGSSNVGSIYFSDATSGPGEYDGYIQYNQSTRLLQFGTAATTRLQITSSGVVIAKCGAVAEIGPLTSASTVTPDFASHCNFTLTLGTNVTLANPSNLTQGQSGSIFLIQDGTGSRTAAFGSYWDFAGGAAPTLSTAANSVDRIDYIVRSSTSIHAVATLAYS